MRVFPDRRLNPRGEMRPAWGKEMEAVAGWRPEASGTGDRAAPVELPGITPGARVGCAARAPRAIPAGAKTGCCGD